METISQKECSKCRKTKPLIDFYFEKTKNRFSSECRLCANERHKSREKKRSPERAEAVRRRQMGYRVGIKKECMAAYGGKCSCCGENTLEFLSIDHVKGGGTRIRKSGLSGGGHTYRMLKKQGWPQEDYRVLCHNCNQSLGIYGYCPHQAEKA